MAPLQRPNSGVAATVLPGASPGVVEIEVSRRVVLGGGHRGVAPPTACKITTSTEAAAT